MTQRQWVPLARRTGLGGISNLAGAAALAACGAEGGATGSAILRTLEAQNGNKKITAEILGISRRSLYNKLAEYGIESRRRTQ